MNKKILFFIFAILLFFIILLLLLLLNSADKGVNNTNEINKIEKKENSISKNSLNSWAKKLSNYKKTDYILPVNDFFIRIKSNKKEQNIAKNRVHKIFRLLIPNLNNYSMFCIFRILDNTKLPYTIEKSYEKSEIYIDTKNSVYLKNILLNLKKYNIKSKIELIDKKGEI